MDFQIRTAAFNWLEKQVLLHGDLLPRKILEQGFYFHGQRVTLLGPPGIWKPKALELPISITTVANGPYDDVITTKGMLEYRYRGTDPHHRDNVGLRETMRNNIPLIYFLGIEPGKYLAEWPVFIVEDLPQTLIFRVLIDEKSLVESMTKLTLERRYMYLMRLLITGGNMLPAPITKLLSGKMFCKSWTVRCLNTVSSKCTIKKLYSPGIKLTGPTASGWRYGLTSLRK